MNSLAANQAIRFVIRLLAVVGVFLFAISAVGYRTVLMTPRRVIATGRQWSQKLDDHVRFYQSTDMGLIIAGTKKSLYAIDSETGDVMWRRRNLRVDQTDIAPVVGTDLLLINHQKDGRSRIEAADIMTGKPIWQSDKLSGSIMHLAVDADAELAALVLVRETKGPARDRVKRRPNIHLLNLASGNQLWKRELGSELEMMPSRWGEKEDGIHPRQLSAAALSRRATLFVL
jgi:hypothetical protein